jgi:hypothetical protein
LSVVEEGFSPVDNTWEASVTPPGWGPGGYQQGRAAAGGMHGLAAMLGHPATPGECPHRDRLG